MTKIAGNDQDITLGKPPREVLTFEMKVAEVVAAHRQAHTNRMELPRLNCCLRFVG